MSEGANGIALGLLDFDDVASKIGQKPRAEGTGDCGAQFNRAEACEWSGGR
jgi:hypothetical protein